MAVVRGSRIPDWRADSGRPARRHLPDGQSVTATCVTIANRGRFRIPSVLAGSALIDFESHHRPPHSVDGIILMTDSILLGPRQDHHISCPDWPELVVIYTQDGVLRCRSKSPLSINGMSVRDSAVLSDGTIVSGDDFRFRIERLRAL